MRRTVLALACTAILAALAAPGGAAPVAPSTCTLFPADNAWRADVRALPVHAQSEAWLAAMGGKERRLHPDFGPAGPGEQPYGIPYQVVDGSTPRVEVDFDYADESDRGPYPLTAGTPIEGGSDRHALIVDRDSCTLYELFAVDWNGGHPTAGSGAIWDLNSNALRTAGWTSADAAGLPILPGLVRRDEVLTGEIDHAIRITASRTHESYLWPARHEAGRSDPSLPPMGARFRLRAGFDISMFRPDTQVVLRAMQRYGVILADNGSNWYFTGASEEGWETDMLDELKSIQAGAFEGVDASGLMVHPDSGQVRGAPAPPTTAPVTSPPTTRPAPTTTSPPATPTTAAPTTTTTVAVTTTTAAEAATTTAPSTSTTAPSTSTTGPRTGERAAGARSGGGSGGRTALLLTAIVAAALGALGAAVGVYRRVARR
jgi:hypothetical protein